MLIAAAILFLGLCIVLGVFITGTGMSLQTHVRIGLKGIFISYLLGLTLLIAAIIFS